MGYFVGRISNMADGVPLSAEVTRALSRCAVTSGTVGLWESHLLGAVNNYRYAVSIKGDTPARGASALARKLDSFLRSLSRTANMRATMKHWAGLSSEGRTLIEMHLRLGQASHQSFEDLDLENASDLAVLRDAVGAARRWLGRSLVQNMGRQSERWCGMWHGCTSKRQGRGLV